MLDENLLLDLPTGAHADARIKILHDMYCYAMIHRLGSWGLLGFHQNSPRSAIWEAMNCLPCSSSCGEGSRSRSRECQGRSKNRPLGRSKSRPSQGEDSFLKGAGQGDQAEEGRLRVHLLCWRR